MVEFALVLPILLVVVFGIIEVSWSFAQQNDVRHGAREGARLAAVDFGNTTTIGQEICDRMNVVRDSQAPTITLTPVTAEGIKGGQAIISVDASVETLTGYLDWVFQNAQLTSTIEFQLEQPVSGEAQWWNGGAATNHTC